MKFVAVSLAILSLSLPAMAQSTITLEDFDLGSDPAPAAPASRGAGEDASGGSDMEKCLLDPTACDNSEYKSNTSFSLDDVVNLGIVDREEVSDSQPSTGGAPVTAAADPLPSIDMEILFDYNSANLRPDQLVKIAELSRVLGQDKFQNYRFLLLGHTDAKGSDEYNMALSQKRAQAVATFVTASAGLPDQRVIASGMGASKLKDASDPFGEQNRRVQLVLVPVK